MKVSANPDQGLISSSEACDWGRGVGLDLAAYKDCHPITIDYRRAYQVLWTKEVRLVQ